MPSLIQKNPSFTSWRDMKHRCLNKKDRYFYRYGGRGITVCARWMLFKNFLEDMGTRPKGMVLDRINNDGNYEPANCRWATPLESMRNSSLTKQITFQGETMCISAWSEKVGVSAITIAYRLRAGWPIERALQP